MPEQKSSLLYLKKKDHWTTSLQNQQFWEHTTNSVAEVGPNKNQRKQEQKSGYRRTKVITESRNN